jgi:hypothetical protein
MKNLKFLERVEPRWFEGGDEVVREPERLKVVEGD